MSSTTSHEATLYRMATKDHLCPFGLKSRALLKREGFHVDDHKLRTRAETDQFKDAEHVETTPQTYINGNRIGGYDDLRRYFGLRVRDPKALTYTPVIALFSVTALMALAAAYAAFGTVFTMRTIDWFVAFSMAALAMQKLRDIESFSRMFLGYDLLARRWVRYSYIYPYAELGAGILMIAGILTWVAAPVAIIIGGIGAISVIKAVYVDRRALKCACMGGDSNVPLGFISLTENLMMLAMGVWMLAR